MRGRCAGQVPNGHYSWRSSRPRRLRGTSGSCRVFAAHLLRDSTSEVRRNLRAVRPVPLDPSAAPAGRSRLHSLVDLTEQLTTVIPLLTPGRRSLFDRDARPGGPASHEPPSCPSRQHRRVFGPEPETGSTATSTASSRHCPTSWASWSSRRSSPPCMPGHRLPSEQRSAARSLAVRPGVHRELPLHRRGCSLPALAPAHRAPRTLEPESDAKGARGGRRGLAWPVAVA